MSRGRRAATIRRYGQRAALSAIALIAATAAVSAVDTPTATALEGTFQPANIISDKTFYDSATMDAVQVQSFLNERYTDCASGYVCVKDYAISTPNKDPESGLCNGYMGSASESAAQIIAKVAQSCGVNPQVLLVLLQKESSLLTTRTPSYNTVTGYGCPDTAACNTSYYGFFNQTYLAARQFKLYRLYPTNYGYVAGRMNYILYSPNGACGGSQVFIENQATAGLYNYTPYQPNAAALANPNGVGDSCSSYGNRNFWVFFNTWFQSAPSPALLASQYYLNDSYGATANTVFTYGDPTDVEVHFGDWDGNGTDTPLVRRGDKFYVRNSNTSGVADVVFQYGNPGDVILTGDWDGNGTDTLAVRRGSVYYIRDSITSGTADTVITYGDANDYALSGDWNGDGMDTLAVRRDNLFYMRNSISTGAADIVLTYGNPGDDVYVGHWAEDHAGDTFAVRRGTTFYLRYSLISGIADFVFSYGNPTDTAFTGDWNGDGIDTIGVRRSAGGMTPSD